MVVRSVRNWPGSKAKVSRSSGGMCSDTATDPAASGWMRETVRSWKRGTALLMVSVRLEVVEGFQAVEPGTGDAVDLGALARDPSRTANAGDTQIRTLAQPRCWRGLPADRKSTRLNS